MSMEERQERYEQVEELLNDFMGENAEMIDELRELTNTRNEALEDLTKEARSVVMKDAKKRGKVDAGLFVFTKKLGTSYDPADLVRVLPKAAEHGVFTITLTVETTEPQLVKDYLKDESATVVVNKKQVDSLAEQGILDKKKLLTIVKEKALTPSFSSGPKPYPVP